MPSLWWWAASIFPGLPCPLDRSATRQGAPRANPASKYAGKTRAQLDAAQARAEARVAAALAGWRGARTKAENAHWKGKTRAADYELERVKSAKYTLGLVEDRQARQRVPAGPLAQLRLFNPRPPRRAGWRTGRR
jgi:hypothetical protein